MKASLVCIAGVFISPVHVALARRDPWAQNNSESNSSNHNYSTQRQYNRGEDSSAKINLLIKYKPSSVQRVRNSFSVSERLNRLASSVSDVSRRHRIAKVEIDRSEKDAVITELLMADDVEMVEEVSCIAASQPPRNMMQSVAILNSQTNNFFVYCRQKCRISQYTPRHIQDHVMSIKKPTSEDHFQKKHGRLDWT